MENELSVNAANGNVEDNNALHERLDYLEKRERELVQEKEEMEAEFGMKRAKLKDLFLQKEDELQRERDTSTTILNDKEVLQMEINKLQKDLDENKSQLTVILVTLDNMETEKRKAEDELASLRQIMEETVNESVYANTRFEKDIKFLTRIKEQLESENQELRSQTTTDKEGVLSVMTKTLAKKVGSLNAHSQSNENLHDNLEYSMKKQQRLTSSNGWWAQEDAEMLRSLVIPLEEEIKALKDKLRAADDQLRGYEAAQVNLFNGSTAVAELLKGKTPTEVVEELDEKLKDMSEDLKVEKSSRSDLEMYVAVLQTQKLVLQDDAEKLRNEIQVSLSDFGNRKTGAQRSETNMATFSVRKRLSPSPHREKPPEVLKQSIETPLSLNDVLALDGSKSEVMSLLDTSVNEDSTIMDLFSSSVDLLSRPTNLFMDDDLLDSTMNPPLSERIPSLTEAQFKALADLTPEQEMRKVMLQNARTRPETLTTDIEGKRFVSEKEWQLLQDEVKRARDKMSRTCDMCSNYEAQLQNVQEHEKELEKKIQQLVHTIEQSKHELNRELSVKKELEEKFNTMATQVQDDLDALNKQLEENENACADVQQRFRGCYDSVHEQLKLLSDTRDQVQANLNQLQAENDSLVGKHSAHAQQMQNEEIDLPSDMNEMYHLLLKMREDLIVAKVAKEQTEETLRGEIMFLKDHVKSEHQLKDNLEDTLTQEIDMLRTQVGICESIKQQFEEEHKKRSELERLIREQEELRSGLKQLINGLQKQTEDLNAAKNTLEQEVYQLKCKVQALQVELENGEAVQRDFVKLSQSLQVQLEKIRDSENEVRWQHEEDIVECTTCKQPFHGPTRKRRHCRHCGKIFCYECTSKVVLSGPNNRQSKVCDVCHTLLVPNTAPYFSKEPPHTPD
uniref:FYVE-type domain-containing protein n=1 Tax=Strigamia maritima TaxID=126957 RepID=T1JG88_STRMM